MPSLHKTKFEDVILSRLTNMNDSYWMFLVKKQHVSSELIKFQQQLSVGESFSLTLHLVEISLKVTAGGFPRCYLSAVSTL